MKKIQTLFAALILAGLMASVHADEIGPGNPTHSTTSSMTTTTTTSEPAPVETETEEMSLLEYFLSLFE